MAHHKHAHLIRKDDGVGSVGRDHCNHGDDPLWLRLFSMVKTAPVPDG